MLHATIESGPTYDPLRISDVYPVFIELTNIHRLKPTVSVREREVRDKLGAFKKGDRDRWAWFVRRPQMLSKHDFELLTAQKSGR